MAEIVIVSAISSFVLLSASMIMSRTTRTFKKGTDLMNTQVLMENIVMRLRSDVRALLRVTKFEDGGTGGGKTTFSFVARFFQLGKNPWEETVTYIYENNTLYREVAGKKHDFGGEKQVVACAFKPQPDTAGFKFLNLVLQLRSNSPGEGPATTLSLVTQFHASCLFAKNPFFDPAKHTAVPTP